MVQDRPVIAHHLIWTACGWWLPNDPRGSGSTSITGERSAELGEIHPGRKKVQPPRQVVREFYDHAAEVLKHPLMTFDEADRAKIADAFADVVAMQGYTCYACAAMPDHVHVLIRKHKHRAEQMGDHFRELSRLRLIETGRREAEHPVWCGGNVWKIFVYDTDHMWNTIRYIERNPSEIGLPKQEWPFVSLYDNWPFHKTPK